MRKLLTVVLALVSLYLTYCASDETAFNNSFNRNITVEKPGEGDSRSISPGISVNSSVTVNSLAPCPPINSTLETTIASNSTKLRYGFLAKPCGIVNTERCSDGDDNDGDGLVDEGCFGCFASAKKGDFNNDGAVTMLDCGVPILIENGVTTMTNSASCADLNGDGLINIDDTLVCLDILHGTGQPTAQTPGQTSVGE